LSALIWPNWGQKIWPETNKWPILKTHTLLQRIFDVILLLKFPGHSEQSNGMSGN